MTNERLEEVERAHSGCNYVGVVQELVAALREARADTRQAVATELRRIADYFDQPVWGLPKGILPTSYLRQRANELVPQPTADTDHGMRINEEGPEMVCAEVYQLLGSIIYHYPDLIPNVEKWLDNLSQNKIVHKNLLPVDISEVPRG